MWVYREYFCAAALDPWIEKHIFYDKWFNCRVLGDQFEVYTNSDSEYFLVSHVVSFCECYINKDDINKIINERKQVLSPQKKRKRSANDILKVILVTFFMTKTKFQLSRHD